MDDGGSLWLVLTVGGVIVLGLALAYATFRNRKLTPREDARSEQATKEVYAAENRDPANR